MLLVALEAAARGAIVAPEAAFVITFAPHRAAAAAFTHEAAIFVTLRTAAGVPLFVIGHESTLLVAIWDVAVSGHTPLPSALLTARSKREATGREHAHGLVKVFVNIFEALLHPLIASLNFLAQRRRLGLCRLDRRPHALIILLDSLDMRIHFSLQRL
jgi:hypothetical protein